MSPNHVVNIVPPVKTIPTTTNVLTLGLVTRFKLLKALKPAVIAIDCTNASTIVKYLVTWFNFLRPTSPCLLHSTNLGTISICNNWTTICAVIYGETPIANSEKLVKPPPLKIFNILINPEDATLCRALALIPGTVI